jgi:hypothetical protein
MKTEMHFYMDLDYSSPNICESEKLLMQKLQRKMKHVLCLVHFSHKSRSFGSTKTRLFFFFFLLSRGNMRVIAP